MSELIPLLDMEGNTKKEMGADVLPYAVRHLIENQNAIIRRLTAKPKFARMETRPTPSKKKRK